MKRIVIENTVCCNTGDRAILLCAEQSLKQAFGPDLSLTIFDCDAAAAAKLYPEHRFRPFLARRLFSLRRTPSKLHRAKNRLRNLRARAALFCARAGMWPAVRLLIGAELGEDLKTYAAADLILTTGGTYLVENYNLKERIAQFGIDLALGKAPVFFTQSLGPFHDADNIHGLRRAFDAAPLMLLRDEKSASHLQGLVKNPAKCHIVADSVFMLADIARLKERLKQPFPSAPPKKIAISVREWPYFQNMSPHEGMDNYKNALASLSEYLIRTHDARITFISSCQGVPTYADDSRVAGHIIDLLPEDIQDRVTLESDHHTPHQLMEILKDMDLLVGTRMHMLILALCVGTPVLPISYEFKTAEMIGRMGLDDLLSDIETMTPENLCAKAARLIGDLPRFHRIMLEETITQHASACQATTLIRETLSQ